MGLIQATIETLAGVLGCRQDQAEDVVHSPASARAAMSRRGFFMAAGAVAAGVVMLDAATAEAAYEYRLITYSQLVFGSPHVMGRTLVRQRKGVYVASFSTRPMSSSDYLFLAGDRHNIEPSAEYRGSDGNLWRFQDDTRELVCRSDGRK